MASTCEAETQSCRLPVCMCELRQSSSSEMLNNIPESPSACEECIRKTRPDTLYCSRFHGTFLFYQPPATAVFCNCRLYVTQLYGHLDRLLQRNFSVISNYITFILCISYLLNRCLTRSQSNKSRGDSCQGSCVKRPLETIRSRRPEDQEATNRTLRQTSCHPHLEQKAPPAQEPSRPNDVNETVPVTHPAISWQSSHAQNGGQSLSGVSAGAGTDPEKTDADKIPGSGTNCNCQQTHSHRITRSGKLRSTPIKPGLAATRKKASLQGRTLSLSYFREALGRSHFKNLPSLPQRNRRSHGKNLKEEQLEKTDAKTASRAKTTGDDLSAILKELLSAPTIRFAEGVRSHVFTAERGENVREERVRLVSFHTMRPNIPSSGVWVTQLAAAGFYCPHAGCSIVRCAFCDVNIELSRFVRRNPADLHKRESPDCPLVTGRADNVSFQQRGQDVALLWLQNLNADHDAASNGRLSASEQQQKQGDNKGRSAHSHLADSKSETCPHPLQQPQSQPAASAFFPNHSLTTLSPQAQPLVTTSESKPQSLVASASASVLLTSSMASSATKMSSSSSMSRTPVGQYPADRGSSTTGFTSLPPPNTPAPTTASTSPSPSPMPSRSAASAPLASQLEVDAPRSAEPASEISGCTGTESRNQRAAGQTMVDSSRSVPRPARPQQTDSRLPYQSARVLDPAEQQQQERSSDAPGRSGNGSRSSQSTTTGSTNEPAPDPSTQPPARQLVTYRQLGIYTEEPKRPDFAISSLRLNTYDNQDSPWPHPTTHKPEDMAQAGFYYVGTGDTVRCFYCKGGLQGWADCPDPWVEHATHFPQCPFVSQVKGPEFVEAAQALKGTRNSIVTKDIEEELERRQRQKPATANDDLTQCEEPAGGTEDGDRGAEGGAHGADELKGLSELVEELETENNEMLDSRTCKICQTNDVNILFLPCGHLVSCAECSPALRTCAICRQRVKGRVRVQGRET